MGLHNKSKSSQPRCVTLDVCARPGRHRRWVRNTVMRELTSCRTGSSETSACTSGKGARGGAGGGGGNGCGAAADDELRLVVARAAAVLRRSGLRRGVCGRRARCGTCGLRAKRTRLPMRCVAGRTASAALLMSCVLRREGLPRRGLRVRAAEARAAGGVCGCCWWYAPRRRAAATNADVAGFVCGGAGGCTGGNDSGRGAAGGCAAECCGGGWRGGAGCAR